MKVLNAHKYQTKASWSTDGWRFVTRDDVDCDKEILYVSRARVVDLKNKVMYVYCSDGTHFVRSINK